MDQKSHQMDQKIILVRKSVFQIKCKPQVYKRGLSFLSSLRLTAIGPFEMAHGRTLAVKNFQGDVCASRVNLEESVTAAPSCHVFGFGTETLKIKQIVPNFL